MDINWQLKFNSIKERNAQLFATGLNADCSFKVGENEKIFVAHKLILSAASPVFERMFFGRLAEKSDHPIIIIVDIEESDFYDLLNHAYTDTVNITSIEKAQNLMYAAQKYMMDQLMKKCTLFIAENLTANNVLSSFELAKQFNEEGLAEKCLEFIRCNTTNVLKSPELFLVKLDTLANIVNQPLLNIVSELELFAALDEYAKFYAYFANHSDGKVEVVKETLSAKCLLKENDSKEKQEAKVIKDVKLAENSAAAGGSTEIKIKKDIVEENVSCNEIISQFQEFQKVVKKVRFLNMTANEFANGPAFSKLLVPKDALAIFACIVNSKLTAQHFPQGFVDLKKPRE